MKDNVFFKDFNQNFNSVPFDEYKTEDFLPAIKIAIDLCNDNINKIINNKEEPDFENTILAFETSSEELDYISNIYWHLYGAHSDAEFKKLSDEISPMLAKHRNSYTLNEGLFEKIKSVYTSKNGCKDEYDLKLTEDFYVYFKRNGAELNKEDKNTLKDIDATSASLILETWLSNF